MSDIREKRQIVEIILYLFLAGIVLFLGVFGGYSLLGFEENFKSGIFDVQSYLGNYLLYIPLMLISLLVVIYSAMNFYFIRKGEHPATQSQPGFLRIFTVSYIFNPENSLLWNLPGQKKYVRWMTNILRVTMISLILFGYIGVLQLFFPQFIFADVPAQQVSGASDVIFGSAIPSFTENGTLLFMLSFLSGILAFLCSKFIAPKYGRNTAIFVFFAVSILIIAPLMGLLWMSFHAIVYGNSEASLLATFAFGTIGSIITIVTGIFLFWFFWHLMNNGFKKIAEISTSNETVAILWIATLTLVTIIYVGIEIFIYRRSKKKGFESHLTQ